MQLTTYADLLTHIERMEEFANLFLDTIRDHLSTGNKLDESAAYRAMRYLEFLGEEALIIADCAQLEFPEVDWAMLAIVPSQLSRCKDMKSRFGIVKIYYKGIPDQLNRIREAREHIQANCSQVLLQHLIQIGKSPNLGGDTR